MTWLNEGKRIAMGDELGIEVEKVKLEEAKPLIKSKTGIAGIIGAVIGIGEVIAQVSEAPEITDITSSVALIGVSLASIYGRVKADTRISGLIK